MPPLKLVAVLIAAILAGCASLQGLSPHLTPRGADSIAGSDALLTTAALSPAAWPAEDWWTALGDPQLEQLVQQALRDNPGLEAADARTRLALAQAGSADAARQPSLGAGVSSSGIRIPESVIEPPIGGHYSALNSVSLKFDYGFDLWGGKRATWEAAVDRVHASEVDAQAARITLSGNVARAYADLAHAHAMADVAERELDRARHVRGLTDQRVRAGLDSALQFKQADARVPAAEQQLAAARLGIEQTGSALAALVGAAPGFANTFGRPARLNPVALALPTRMPVELIGRRPDIVAARWRVEAASKDIDVAKTAFYPNVDLGAAIGLASLGMSHFLSAQSRYYQFAPALSLPIFDGGRRRADLSARDAEYDLVVADYNQALVSALHQVGDAISGVRSLDVQIEATQRSTDTLRAAYELAMQRYHGGVGNYLEALSVQQSLLDAELQITRLHAQRIDAGLALVQALGGGYQPDDANHSTTRAVAAVRPAESTP